MKYKIKLVFIMLSIIILDQIVKFSVLKNFADNNLSFIEDLIIIGNMSNTNTAYSLGENSILLLIIVTVIIIYVLSKILIVNYRKLSDSLKLGIGLILAGEISNLMDMVFRGYALKIAMVLKRQVFNLADISITLGIFLIVISILVLMVKSQEEK